MKKITKAELTKILASHAKWLAGKGGERADLSSAYLRGADLYLRGAYRGADLSSADLGNQVIFTAGPIGSRADNIAMLRLADGTVQIRTGCFLGDADAFRAAIAKTHGENEHAKAYLAVLSIFELMCAAKPIEAREEVPAWAW